MTELLTLLNTLAIVSGGVWAVIQLRVQLQQTAQDRKEAAKERKDAARDRRSEWLWKLSSEFYANEKFGQLRRELDDPSLRSWSEISPDRFDDFLNFLEHVAVLSDTGQFDRKYIHAIFGYWVERIRGKRGSDVYLKKYGYAHLLAWVENRIYW